jgi:hypothetical protein
MRVGIGCTRLGGSFGDECGDYLMETDYTGSAVLLQHSC